MSSLREQILSAKDISSELVEVPEWGVTVEVRSLTQAQRGKLLSKAVDKAGNTDLAKMYPWMIQLVTYDPATGERVFAEEDIVALGTKSSAAADRIVAVALRLSGLDQSVESLGKN